MYEEVAGGRWGTILVGHPGGPSWGAILVGHQVGHPGGPSWWAISSCFLFQQGDAISVNMCVPSVVKNNMAGLHRANSSGMHRLNVSQPYHTGSNIW
ncbi:hypothetical protein KUCAC02_014721 [Chaenocephalus aceratus]|uniref:Uncharacterized protein n=1 Tax=Chaenocephalus aceratus TaxID=36190 RepID=A0ACB9WFA2_CHAAC|nr:hypothetical protein KUCAC02_014721 [Chaenocephalus aceratus]